MADPDHAYEMMAQAKAQALAKANMQSGLIGAQFAEPARPVNVTTLLEKLETLRQDLVDLHSHASAIVEFLEPSPKNQAASNDAMSQGAVGSASPVDHARDMVAACSDLVGRVNQRLFVIERRAS